MAATIANGQLAATSTDLLGTYLNNNPTQFVDIALANTDPSLTEIVIFTVTVGSGGTARRVAYITLAPNETAVINNLSVEANLSLKGQATDASKVDYVIWGSVTVGPMQVLSYDTNGALKTVQTGNPGNQSITGNLSVTGTETVTGAVTAAAANTLGATGGVTTGAASVATVITGPLTRGVGSSTAAAGSATGDAGALPAGTHGVYPTTGADDTKGVVISTSDKVTGRMLFIGNGVSNKILKIYPPSGGTINGAAGDAAFSTASGKGALLVCLSSGANTWLALG